MNKRLKSYHYHDSKCVYCRHLLKVIGKLETKNYILTRKLREISIVADIKLVKILND